MGDHVRRTWVQENNWVCSSCKTTNPGRSLLCSNCGSDKEKHELDVAVVPDASKAVTNSALLEKAKSGPHWICEFCGADQWSFKNSCGKCGATKSEQKKSAPRKSAPLRAAPGVPPPRRPPVVTSVVRKPVELPTADPIPDLRSKNYLLLACVCVGVFALVSIILWVFVPHKVRSQVASVYWKHTHFLEERTTRHGEDWGSPAGAFNVSCERKLKDHENCHPHNCNPHTERYQCGSHDCNCRQSCTKSGNGFSSCSEVCSTCADYCTRTAYDTCYDQCPVYDDWCRYDYYAWPVIAQQSVDGTTPTVTWPALTAQTPLQRIRPVAEYRVVFNQRSESWTHKPGKLEEFQQFIPGARWEVKVNRVGQVWPVKMLTD